MDTLEVVLIALASAAVAALVVSALVRRRYAGQIHDHRQEVREHREQSQQVQTHAERKQAELHHTRADVTEEVARERAARERLTAELHEARARITELEGSSNGGLVSGGRRR